MGKKTIVVAYSGGLDTSVIVHWLKQRENADIIAYCADLGQGVDQKSVKEKALLSGATEVIIEDLTADFIEHYAFKALKASALYEGYPLATALGRPLIAKRMIEVAKQYQAQAVCHGCTAKGNDQVRFDLAFMTLAPNLEIMAPLRYWELKTRESEIEYLKEHNIPIEVSLEKPYSLDMNIWGQSTECGILENPWNPAPDNAYQITKNPQEGPDKPSDIAIQFEHGVPVALNGKSVTPLECVQELHKIGAQHGVGRIDLVENRLIGIKSREIYEAPAATILHTAHTALENLVSSKKVFELQQHMSLYYAQIVYEGRWFSPEREALDAFFESSQKIVSGEVVLSLFKGSCSVKQRKSDQSLYSENLATYSYNDTFHHQDAKGFIECYGLPYKVWGKVNQK